MKRKIITIDHDKCNGCGLCAEACHEGAIGMVDGKAKLLRDDYCDGLGACLPACPTGAITFEEREAAQYNEAAVKEHLGKKEVKETAKKKEIPPPKTLACGCPGTNSKSITPKKPEISFEPATVPVSRLSQWPVQIKLVPINAPYFDGANILIAADCSAFAYGDFHNKFIKNHVTLIGCPKLDMVDYSEKLTEIFKNNNIKSLTIVRMEVPCCGGIEHAAIEALKNSGKFIPWQVYTISTDGEILE